MYKRKVYRGLFAMGLEDLASLRQRRDALAVEMDSCGLGEKVTQFEFARLMRQKKEIERVIRHLESFLTPDGIA